MFLIFIEYLEMGNFRFDSEGIFRLSYGSFCVILDVFLVWCSEGLGVMVGLEEEMEMVRVLFFVGVRGGCRVGWGFGWLSICFFL